MAELGFEIREREREGSKREQRIREGFLEFFDRRSSDCCQMRSKMGKK